MEKTIYKYDFKKKIKGNQFSFKQAQLKSQRSFYDSSVVNISQTDTTFDCVYIENKNFNSQKPTLLISIKDNSDLLKITLNNLYAHTVHQIVNIFIIDDRPQSDLNKRTAIEFDCSYLEVKNSQNIFNFSMLHNLAVHTLYKKHKNLKTFILWNSDLWIGKTDTLAELLRLHSENKSTISGTKLLYPDQTFAHYDASRSKTVQFGGSMFAPRQNEAGLFPWHLYRGYPSDDEKVNCNKGELFITGAFMIVDAKWFIESGGFCPVFTICFQDVDLCLRAATQNKKVFYFGKDLELYHYESYLRGKDDEKMDQPTDVDGEIYTKLWSYERVSKLLFKFN